MEEVKVKELLLRMKNGDESAFSELYVETRDDVFRMIAFLIPNPNDAVEACSDVYIQLWKSFQSYEDSRPFRYWLHGIAIRQASSYKRKLWRGFRLFEKQKLLLQPSVSTSADPLVRKETRDELLQEIMKLSPKLRTVLVLRYYHDYSFEEMASLLDVPIGTVKSRHHSALTGLRNTWTLTHNHKEDILSGTRTSHSTDA
jgi:RNA polymerase sigma-70 factor (ECF subfamily)